MDITLAQLTEAYRICGFAPRPDDPLTFEQQGVPYEEQLMFFHSLEVTGTLQSGFVLQDVEQFSPEFRDKLAEALQTVVGFEQQ